MKKSKIVLGTVQFGLDYGINNNSSKPPVNQVFDVLDQAYNDNIRTLDTAEAYGTAEDVIGSYHNERGNRFEINTKFVNRQNGELSDTLRKSLKRLQVDQINMYYFHSFNDYKIGRGLKDELETLKTDQGLIRSVGLSVYTNEELSVAIKDPFIDVIQLPFNLLDNYTKRGELLKEAKKANKIIQVRSVFLQGLFFKETSTLPALLLPLKSYLDKLHGLCREIGMSMEALCLHYVNSQPDIDEIIIGVDSKEQLLTNLKSLGTSSNMDIRGTIDKIMVKENELLYPYNWK